MKNFILVGGGCKILSVAPRGAGDPITKIRKGVIQNGCPNPHRKFQHSSSIRKSLKIGGTDSTFGLVVGPPRGGRGSDFKNSKVPHTYRWSEPIL